MTTKELAKIAETFLFCEVESRYWPSTKAHEGYELSKARLRDALEVALWGRKLPVPPAPSLLEDTNPAGAD